MSMDDPAPGYRQQGGSPEPQPVAPAGLGYVPEGYLPADSGRAPGRRRWLWIAAGITAIVLVSAGVTAAVLARRWDGRPASGDTAFTLHLTGSDGGRPSGDAVARTKEILLSRLRALDVTRPTATAIGGQTLLVTTASVDAERARAVLVPGNLAFRMVVSSTDDRPGAGCLPDSEERTDPAAALAAARAKLGATYEVAAAVTDPAGAGNLPGFDALTCAEVAALPPGMQYAVPAVTCAMLDGRPPGSLDDGAKATACDTDGVKYLLDVTRLDGTDLAGAQARFDETGGWVVSVHFTGAGQPKFTALTRDAVDAGQRRNVWVKVAVVMDNAVITAPEIAGTITGDADLSGGPLSKREEASRLAVTLDSGALPVRLVITAVETVR